jgi:hypothetical protein
MDFSTSTRDRSPILLEIFLVLICMRHILLPGCFFYIHKSGKNLDSMNPGKKYEELQDEVATLVIK